MAALDLGTKLRWFDRGAAAFARAFPEALEHLGPDPPSYYVCPECPKSDDSGNHYLVRLHPRTAVESGELTTEHVPPESFGGRGLILTCKQCNDFAGHHLDADARRCENPADALLGTAPESSRVIVRAGKYSVRASLKADTDFVDLTIPPLAKNANDARTLPGFWNALRESAAQGSGIQITFSGDMHRPRRALVCWLRHAYLALFALAGYKYVFRPGLGIVRQQIKEPDVEHIPLFLAALPERRPWTERRIIRVCEPEWCCSFAVQFGGYIVFLPRPGDVEFYERLAAQARICGHGSTFAGDVLGWPTEPYFGL